MLPVLSWLSERFQNSQHSQLIGKCGCGFSEQRIQALSHSEQENPIKHINTL